MISKTDLKTIFEWAKHKDFPIKKTSVYPQSIYKKNSSGYYKKSYGTDKIHSYSNKEIYSFPLKFGRKKPIIRESLISSNIIDILKNDEILYTVVSVFQSETFLKPHRDPHIYKFPYKRIQIPLVIPDKKKCYMEWTDIKGGIVNWDEGVPQVCDVMHHTHQAYNKTNKEMVIMMIDVKMDTVVEL